MKSHFDEHTDKIRERRHRLAGFKHGARQPRLAMEANVKPDAKIRKRTEEAGAVQAKYGDICFVNQADPDEINLTSFGNDSTGPSALPYTRDDALVSNGASATEPCLSPAEMRTRTATGGLLPAGTASTATRTIFP